MPNPDLTIKDSVVYITLAPGEPSYRLDAVLARLARNALSRESRDDNTQQRLYEKYMTSSRDMPGSRAARADFADGHGECAILRAVDRLFKAVFPPKPPLTESERQSRVAKAADYVAKHLGYRKKSDGYAEILSIFCTVYAYPDDCCKALCEKFDMTKDAYKKRLERYAEILEATGWGS